MKKVVEHHPWKWYVPSNARCLIIGTHPTPRRNWSFEFFYPNKRNFFWKIVAALRNQQFAHDTGALAVKERQLALEEMGVGITDMGMIIQRQDDSALDECLQVIEYMDIHYILDSFPMINTILLTSSSGEVSAKAWFQKYLAKKNIILKFRGKEKISSYNLDSSKRINVVILPSPSPRYANDKRIAAITSKYREYLTTQLLD